MGVSRKKLGSDFYTRVVQKVLLGVRGQPRTRFGSAPVPRETLNQGGGKTPKRGRGGTQEEWGGEAHLANRERKAKTGGGVKKAELVALDQSPALLLFHSERERGYSKTGSDEIRVGGRPPFRT